MINIVAKDGAEDLKKAKITLLKDCMSIAWKEV